MKNILKNNSAYLVFLTIAETILSIVCTVAFVYTDSLSYADSQVITELGIEKLLENMYSSTWWALILLVLAFIAIFSIASMVFRKMDYLFLSICCWGIMFILSLNLNKAMIDILLNLCLFIPIFILNIIAYKGQEKKINAKIKKKHLNK